MDFERGFKSWAERAAFSLRRELRLHSCSPLAPQELARHLRVRLCTPKQIPGLQTKYLNQLLKHDPSGWSAVSICSGEFRLVIYNPTHSRGRQASDITHELAHLFLDHKPAMVVMSHDGSIAMRTYNQSQEDEANWLAWCLLLPREALVRCRRAGDDSADIAIEYGVTESLVNFRLRVTGVEAQVRASRR
jgi:Zn-dependent peptidase ImmA (M78 family)